MRSVCFSCIVSLRFCLWTSPCVTFIGSIHSKWLVQQKLDPLANIIESMVAYVFDKMGTELKLYTCKKNCYFISLFVHRQVYLPTLPRHRFQRNENAEICNCVRSKVNMLMKKKNLKKKNEKLNKRPFYPVIEP